MKDIILAGGNGTRLYPGTQAMSKQLLLIYDKPMTYYPLSVLMLAGIKEILIISTPQALPLFKDLLGDGSEFGISLFYFTQPSPDDFTKAFIAGENFIGDNIFYGHGLIPMPEKATELEEGAVVFGYQVIDPEHFAVVEFDENLKVLSIGEKPTAPKSPFTVTGLYCYDSSVVEIAKNIDPWECGELETITVNQEYFKRDQLKVELLRCCFAWLDIGMHDSLLEASTFIQTLECRQGYKACLEEIAYNYGCIDKEQVLMIAEALRKAAYGKCLIELVNYYMLYKKEINVPLYK